MQLVFKAPRTLTHAHVPSITTSICLWQTQHFRLLFHTTFIWESMGKIAIVFDRNSCKRAPFCTTIVAIILILCAQHQLHLQHIWLLFSEHCSLYSSAMCCRSCCCCCSCCSYHFEYRTFIFFCIFDDFEWRQQYFSVDLIDFVCRVFVFVFVCT